MSESSVQVPQRVNGNGNGHGNGNGTIARKPTDYASDRDVRWCPGCGDYSILSQMKKILADRGEAPESLAFVSGIGCSSRFPYYLDTYGIHSIHGRALPIALGLKAARPEMSVWVATGDGDGLSIGGNHMLHALRRNLNVKVVLFNNRIYGLTKGQLSPTSEFGKRTVSTPSGSIDTPICPIGFAINAGATFVARSVDRNPKHLQETLERAAAHKGAAFIEVYQNCNIFNDGAFGYAFDRNSKEDNIVELKHGEPLIFGKNRDKGIVLDGFRPKAVALGENGVSEKDLLVHDEHAAGPELAWLLSRMRHPEFPEPIGVFRDVEAPTFDELLEEKVRAAREKKGAGDLQALLTGSETWEVK